MWFNGKINIWLDQFWICFHFYQCWTKVRRDTYPSVEGYQDLYSSWLGWTISSSNRQSGHGLNVCILVISKCRSCKNKLESYISLRTSHWWWRRACQQSSPGFHCHRDFLTTGQPDKLRASKISEKGVLDQYTAVIFIFLYHTTNWWSKNPLS